MRNFGKKVILEVATPLAEFATVMPSRCVGDTEKLVNTVAFCAGSGKSLITSLPQHNVDLFITGEAGYHDEVFCELNDITLMLLGHYESEILVLNAIQKRLYTEFPKLTIDVI